MKLAANTYHMACVGQHVTPGYLSRLVTGEAGKGMMFYLGNLDFLVNLCKGLKKY